jgi:hypothetical protein
LLYLGFASCEKDTATSTREATYEAVLLKNVDPPALHPEGFDCEYQIVSVTTSPTPPPGTYFAYNLGTEDQCSGHYGLCNYFNYAETDYCDPNYNGICSNVVASGISKPTQWYPFICFLDHETTFGVLYENARIYEDFSCLPYGSPSSTVVARIRCKGDGCGEATDYWHTSDHFSLSWVNGSPQFPRATVTLTDCGCSPSISMDN